jgi:AbiV family abortive infection protein
MKNEHISKTMAAVLKNAYRLLQDAHLLAHSERYQSATSLAVLSMEESAKACIILWRSVGFIERDIQRDIRSGHINKHRLFAAYEIAKYFVKQFDAGLNEESLRKHVTDETQADTIISTMGRLISAETGGFDLLKQSGFYVDINPDLSLAGASAAIDKNTCARTIQEAELAFEMAEQDPVYHSVMSGIYEKGVLTPGTKEEKQKLRVLSEAMRKGADERLAMAKRLAEDE